MQKEKPRCEVCNKRLKKLKTIKDVIKVEDKQAFTYLRGYACKPHKTQPPGAIGSHMELRDIIYTVIPPKPIYAYTTKDYLNKERAFMLISPRRVELSEGMEGLITHLHKGKLSARNKGYGSVDTIVPNYEIFGGLQTQIKNSMIEKGITVMEIEWLLKEMLK